MKLTKNFELVEFVCRDGSRTPEPAVRNLKILAEQLQVLRDHLDKPIKVNSGYRSPTYNRKVGGAINSQHLLGTAADFVVEGMTPQQVVSTIEKLIVEGKMRQGGLSAYPTFAHYDCRGTKARW